MGLTGKEPGKQKHWYMVPWQEHADQEKQFPATTSQRKGPALPSTNALNTGTPTTSLTWTKAAKISCMTRKSQGCVSNDADELTMIHTVWDLQVNFLDQSAITSQVPYLECSIAKPPTNEPSTWHVKLTVPTMPTSTHWNNHRQHNERRGFLAPHAHATANLT